MNPIRFALLLALLALAACASPTPQIIEVTRVAQQTVIVTQLVQETVIVERVITATPVPPTPTPVVTSWTSTQVIDAFTAAGLDVSEPRPMTADDLGLAPNLMIEGTFFRVPSICDCGARVQSFNTPADLQAAWAFYEALGRGNALFRSWLFIKDNILIQMNGDIPEANALQYQAALEALK